MDVMTPTQRRKAMISNRGRTKPERALASALWRAGRRYVTYRGYKKRYGKTLPGQPDIVFPRRRIIVFIDGCFWHGCIECGRHLGLTSQAWKKKIETNRVRDLEVTTQLAEAGWTVFRVPEHDIGTKTSLSETVGRLLRMIHDGSASGDCQKVREFVFGDRRDVSAGSMTAVSLFSGAGLSDLGYELAGFEFVVQVENDERRASVGAANFPSSRWLVENVQGSANKIEAAYRGSTSRDLDLLVATPPCQGMSSANPSRGKRDTGEAEAQEAKNRLMLEVIPVAKLWNPRVIVAENVRQVLTVQVEYDGERKRLLEHLRSNLWNYELYHCVLNVADYGIPQVRSRALVVAVRKDEPCLGRMGSGDLRLWPARSHAERAGDGRRAWMSVQEWMNAMQYEPLDAVCDETARGRHHLHFVPVYEGDRYGQVSQIPRYSGRSAYENATCVTCGHRPVEKGAIHCSCGAIMRSRPYVEREGQAALIRGFQSSYRRMRPDRPAYTVTTNSSHIGSDFKIHPWENRILSILECADLQTVPRFFDWSEAESKRRLYLIRNLVGEAFPTYFTYLHGQVLVDVLSGSCASSDGGADRQ